MCASSGARLDECQSHGTGESHVKRGIYGFDGWQKIFVMCMRGQLCGLLGDKEQRDVAVHFG